MPEYYPAMLLTNERIACGTHATSKKKSLQLIAELLETGIETADNSLPEDEQEDMDVVDALAARERLGCTGMGHGVAIPHGRVNFVDQPIGAIAILDQPIDFDAPDGQPVDIIFGLLMPENQIEQHLDILAILAQFFNSLDNRNALRAASSNAEVLQILAITPDDDSSPNES